MEHRKIRIGTRGSGLALAQVELFKQALTVTDADVEPEIVVITTTGDRLQQRDAKPDTLTKAVFTKELEEALLAGEIDVAIHSAKDLPVEMPDGLVIGGVLSRAPVNDVLVARAPLGEIVAKKNPRIVTGSARRRRQWLEQYPGTEFVTIRGNLDTRVRKLREHPEWDGVILAQAGLERLRPDLGGLAVSILPTAFIKPAPGQGAIAIQCAADRHELSRCLRMLTHRPSLARLRAERALSRAIGGGCHAPLGALARIYDGVCLHLSAVHYADGERAGQRARITGSALRAAELGQELARRMLARES
ncbi:MAG: hydroxymethylbilane synthase [Verrucomicrobiales bacterium]|jgi:hydroxymethylbilane synthase|nr:hydroxymethylbilane synthase [Verrucomicrobiales bacterium]